MSEIIQKLDIGITEGIIDGITVKNYDRERVICDCLRHVNTMDGEIFNVTVQYLPVTMQKSIKNCLRQWDFCTLESLSHGLCSKCTDLLNSYYLIL